MIKYLFTFLVCITLVACKKESKSPEVRAPIRLADLAIEVHEESRQFMLSDKRGGFIVGSTGRDEEASTLHWSINGLELTSGSQIRVNDTLLQSGSRMLAKVMPDQVQKVFEGGMVESISPIEYSDSVGDHAMLVRVELQHPGTISFEVEPAVGFSTVSSKSADGCVILRQSSGKETITIFGGDKGAAKARSITVRGSTRASFLVVYSSEGFSFDRVRNLYASIDSLQKTRSRRMEQLLNSAFLRTSDTTFNKAIDWLGLSLDALLVEGRDTFAVAGLPWDGSIDGRDNARSIAGICLATGNPGIAAPIIRTLARYQDTIAAHSTFGRIANRVCNGRATYEGADVAPWFIREMYEHVTTTNDTALLQAMYPLVKRSMEGTLKYHADSLNFLTHGDNETWMSRGVTRGNRAAEIQLLWYFQQLISSFVATHMREFDDAQRWGQLATKTAKNFSRVFVDTSTNLVYDHLQSNGKGILETRPNALFCLEVMGSEIVEQNVVKQTFNALAYPHGVGTLTSTDKRFHPSANGPDAQFNGPVWTWLTGHLTYALTRFDRQDLSYQLTQSLVRRVLEGDMIGTLPAMLEVQPRAGETQPRSTGLKASLSGMAELIRSVYQDYIGVSVDVPSNVISLYPKLPDEWNKVEFTIPFGSHTVDVKYVRDAKTSRVTLQSSDFESDIKIRFLWMLDSGNAWKGTATLNPRKQLTLVFTEDDALAFDGEDEIDLQFRQKLKGFSQRKEFGGLEFAKVVTR
jgi:hypothetical protein